MIQGESDDDLRRKMGYRERERGEWETEEQFQERMAGMVAFYAAIVQTDLRECTGRDGVMRLQLHCLYIPSRS